MKKTKKTFRLAVTLYLLFILAAVVNMRLHLVPVTWVSVGRLVVGEIDGHADGIGVIATVAIDLIVYGIFLLFVAATIMAGFRQLKSSQRAR